MKCKSCKSTDPRFNWHRLNWRAPGGKVSSVRAPENYPPNWKMKRCRDQFHGAGSWL